MGGCWYLDRAWLRRPVSVGGDRGLSFRQHFRVSKNHTFHYCGGNRKLVPRTEARDNCSLYARFPCVIFPSFRLVVGVRYRVGNRYVAIFGQQEGKNPGAGYIQQTTPHKADQQAKPFMLYT